MFVPKKKKTLTCKLRKFLQDLSLRNKLSYPDMIIRYLGISIETYEYTAEPSSIIRRQDNVREIKIFEEK